MNGVAEPRAAIMPSTTSVVVGQLRVAGCGRDGRIIHTRAFDPARRWETAVVFRDPDATSQRVITASPTTIRLNVDGISVLDHDVALLYIEAVNQAGGTVGTVSVDGVPLFDAPGSSQPGGLATRLTVRIPRQGPAEVVASSDVSEAERTVLVHPSGRVLRVRKVPVPDYATEDATEVLLYESEDATTPIDSTLIADLPGFPRPMDAFGVGAAYRTRALGGSLTWGRPLLTRIDIGDDGMLERTDTLLADACAGFRSSAVRRLEGVTYVESFLTSCSWQGVVYGDDDTPAIIAVDP